MKRIGILANVKKPVLGEILDNFFNLVKESKHQYIIPDYLKSFLDNVPLHIEIQTEDSILDSSDLILSFGGDGTILNTAKKIGKREKPILGINLGGLGFLTASTVTQSKDHIDDFLKGKLKVEKRSLLKLGIDDNEKHKYLLNDLVIDKAGYSRLIKIITNVNDVFLNSYLADGLIISTPTGSTAYSLANGGPIVAPTTPAFIINPICPHTLSNRPIIISDDLTLTIQVQSELGKFNILGDGENIGAFSCETKVILKKADFNTCLVQVPEHDFYTTLRNKLGWGEDIRNKNR